MNLKMQLQLQFKREFIKPNDSMLATAYLSVERVVHDVYPSGLWIDVEHVIGMLFNNAVGDFCMQSSFFICVCCGDLHYKLGWKMKCDRLNTKKNCETFNCIQ